MDEARSRIEELLREFPGETEIKRLQAGVLSQLDQWNEARQVNDDPVSDLRQCDDARPAPADSQDEIGPA